jgi:DNA repair photolyase
MRHGSRIDPPNRFEPTRREADLEHLEWDQEYLSGLDSRPVEYVADASASIVSQNDSPDVPFRYSLNPYRGCQHGCAYCYARPTHEYLGFSAGLDFETKIVVKHDAPELLRRFLARRGWQAEEICFSGVTDCYQPAERQFRLTRRCLEVALECRQPVGIVTKNALVLRDLDLLRQMAAMNLLHVNLSVTTLDAELARAMEPRTSIPNARLRAVRMLANAGVPTRVLVAPVIPGLNDTEVPAILEAAAVAGAGGAGYVLLRLPLTVEPVFLEWLGRTQPLRARRVEQHIRATRGGRLSDAQWGRRMKGHGPIAEQIERLFKVFAHKHGLDRGLPPLDSSQFRPPIDCHAERSEGSLVASPEILRCAQNDNSHSRSDQLRLF